MHLETTDSPPVLIISNSHIMAISLAVREGLVTPSQPLQHLALGGNKLMPFLEYREGQLLPRNDEAKMAVRRATGKSDSVDLRQYSDIVIYGCQLLCRATGADWILKLTQSGTGFSSAARRASYLDSVHDCAQYRFISRIADTGIRKKIVSLPSPFPNECHPAFASVKAVNWQYPRQYLDLLATEMTALGVRYRALPETLLTESKMAVKKEFKAEREDDYSHLNARGGAIVLEAILRSLTP